MRRRIIIRRHKMKKKIKKIGLLITGGTTLDEKAIWDSSINTAKDINAWMKHMPELSLIAEITPIFVCSGNSQLSGIKLWQAISQQIYKIYNDYDGFVILSDVDAILFNGVALSFSLLNLHKPIILTGSQITKEAVKQPDWRVKKLKSYGGLGIKSNLINAVQLATLELPALGIIFGNRCIRAVKAVRTAYQALNIFKSADDTYLAKIDFGISLMEKPEAVKGRLVLKNKFEPSVLQIKYFPGLDFNLVKDSIQKSRGVLLEGLGSEPIAKEFLDSLSKARIPVLIYNKLGLPRYNSKNFIEVSNLTLATALIKFQWALGQASNSEDLRNIIYLEHCHELIEVSGE